MEVTNHFSASQYPIRAPDFGKNAFQSWVAQTAVKVLYEQTGDWMRGVQYQWV